MPLGLLTLSMAASELSCLNDHGPASMDIRASQDIADCMYQIVCGLLQALLALRRLREGRIHALVLAWARAPGGVSKGRFTGDHTRMLLVTDLSNRTLQMVLPAVTCL